jgi:hypothetical protein
MITCIILFSEKSLLFRCIEYLTKLTNNIVIFCDKRYKDKISELNKLPYEIVIDEFILHRIYDYNYKTSHLILLPDSSLLSPEYFNIIVKNYIQNNDLIVHYSIDRLFNIYPTSYLTNCNGSNITIPVSIFKLISLDTLERHFKNSDSFPSTFISLFKEQGINIHLIPYILESINYNVFKISKFCKEKEKHLKLKSFFYKRDLNFINIYDLNHFANDGNHLALLLESRENSNAEFILRQLSRFLPSNYTVKLFVTQNVSEYYCKIADKLANNIKVCILDHSLASVQDYNEIMLSIDFWTQFASFNKVLIFQFDTIMYRKGIEDFYEYDYVGAPWPVEYRIAEGGVGNGGFSLRSINAMIECLKHSDNIEIQPYNNSENNLKTFNGKHPEDVFYSNAMEQLGFRVAPIRFAKHFSNETCYFTENPLGSHQLYKFNKLLADKLLYNSVIPYWHRIETDIGVHRYGWKYVINHLDKCFNNFDGIQFISYVDIEYLFNDNFKCNNKPWVGIIHTTPLNTKQYYTNCNMYNLSRRSNFINDLEYCKGIFTLSKYLKCEVSKFLCKLGFNDIPVQALKHPIAFDGKEWNPDNLDKIRTVIACGSQLRRISTLFKIRVSPFEKIWLPGRDKEKALQLLYEECDEYNVILTDEEINSVQLKWLSDEEYDNITLNSIIVLDQINSSANNVVIECIARNIPVICNRLPAVEEYLGTDYPLYFENIEDIETLVKDNKKILDGYQHLKKMNKNDLHIETFIKNILK